MREIKSSFPQLVKQVFYAEEAMAKTLPLMILGQLVSFALAITSFTVSLITNQGVDAPLSVSFFTYLAMALIFGSILLYRRRTLLVAWYWYALLGFVDVQGNYIVTKAYEYTSITSVTLLDCCTIAWAIVLTRLFLGTRYTLFQFFGVGLCLLGLGLVVASDYEPSVGGGSNPLFGDALVIAGTLFFAMTNVGMEFCVKNRDRIEVMAMIAVFGMLVSASGMATYERKSLETITWSPRLVYAYVGCTGASVMFDTLGPLVLKMGGATLFNLSLLTSDMWVLVIRIFIYKQQVKWLYYPAYALVIVGIYIYLTTGKDENIHIVDGDANQHLEYPLIKEDNSHVGDCTSP